MYGLQRQKKITLFLQLTQQILINISLTIKKAINLDDVYAAATFP